MGNGLPAVTDFGNEGGASLTGVGSGSTVGAGVDDLRGGVAVLFFAACSALAAARAGSFLFFSISVACRRGRLEPAMDRHICKLIGVRLCAGVSTVTRGWEGDRWFEGWRRCRTTLVSRLVCCEVGCRSQPGRLDKLKKWDAAFPARYSDALVGPLAPCRPRKKAADWQLGIKLATTD